MSNVRFPTHLPGLSWEIKITDQYSTLVQKAAAPGYETRVSLGPDPIYNFELNFNYLREHGQALDSSSGTWIPQNELAVLRGFFNARGGDFDSFLLDVGALTKNPADSSVEGQMLTPDSNGYAPLVVTRAGFPDGGPGSTPELFNETIYELALGSAPQLYMSDEPMTPGTDYTIQGPGVATSSASYGGLVAVITKAIAGQVTADFGWLYRVRFTESKFEHEKWMYLLATAKQIQLVTTRN